jgi:hypothetical protein
MFKIQCSKLIFGCFYGLKFRDRNDLSCGTFTFFCVCKGNIF